MPFLCDQRWQYGFPWTEASTNDITDSARLVPQPHHLARRSCARRQGTPWRVYRARTAWIHENKKLKERAISSGSGSDSDYSLQSYKTSMGIAEAVITWACGQLRSRHRPPARINRAPQTCPRACTAPCVYNHNYITIYTCVYIHILVYIIIIIQPYHHGVYNYNYTIIYTCVYNYNYKDT